MVLARVHNDVRRPALHGTGNLGTLYKLRACTHNTQNSRDTSLTEREHSLSCPQHLEHVVAQHRIPRHHGQRVVGEQLAHAPRP